MIKYFKHFIILLITGCGTTLNQNSANSDTLMTVNIPVKDVVSSNVKSFNPIWGYRFKIKGDFNGDGKKETLEEHFFDGVNNKETYKFCNDSINGEIESLLKRKVHCFISSSDKKVDDLTLAGNDDAFGFSFLKNEGDLNGDGTDEISYVVDWADWSNLNTMHVATCKDGTWVELYSFSIWDWQLPDLPQGYNDYGICGSMGKVVLNKSDSLNIVLENELKNFKGLIKKVGKGRIQVIYRTEEADEDTIIVSIK